MQFLPKIVLLMFVACAAVAAQTGVPSQSQSKDQLPPGESERVKRLMNNPDDQELWSAELERQQGLETLLKNKRLSEGDDAILELAFANNYQLQGISYRHLKRYREALNQFSRSQEILKSLRTAHDCAAERPSQICKDIQTQFFLLYRYFASVYLDLEDETNLERCLKLAIEFASEPREIAESLYAITSWNIEKGHYDQAVDITLAEIAKELPRPRKDVLTEKVRAADRVFLMLFRNVSWDLKTNERRTDDPSGFVDEHGIGIGKPFKYGMTSPEEDDATFVTIFFLQEMIAKSPKVSKAELDAWGFGSAEQLRKNVDIDSYVRVQMDSGVFEPAAKYLFCRYTDFSLRVNDKGQLKCREKRPAGVTFYEVRKKLEIAPGKVNSNTQEMIELFAHIDDWLDHHCTR